MKIDSRRAGSSSTDSSSPSQNPVDKKLSSFAKKIVSNQPNRSNRPTLTIITKFHYDYDGTPIPVGRTPLSETSSSSDEGSSNSSNVTPQIVPLKKASFFIPGDSDSDEERSPIKLILLRSSNEIDDSGINPH